MAYNRNNEGKLVTENGELLFSNEIFNQLMAGEHNYLFTPNNNYASMQVEKVFNVYPEDSHKYVDALCSKLMDDNGSLATDSKKGLYTKDVKSFLAVVNKICDTASDDVKNQILGGTFATKNDNDPKSYVPLYLCVEILKSKWNSEYQTSPSETWENFDTNDEKTVPTDSTLAEQINAVVEKLKTLNYDKEYFSSDMSPESSDYVAACQFDSTNSIDIYAQCDEDACKLCATNGAQTYDVEMFKVVNKKVEVPAVEEVPSIPENAILSETTQIVDTPVNVIDDSNDISQAASNDIIAEDNNTINNDVISPSVSFDMGVENKEEAKTDIFNNEVNSNVDIAVSTNNKVSKEELMKLREELRRAQAKYDEAFDLYVSTENIEEEASKSMAA